MTHLAYYYEDDNIVDRLAKTIVSTIKKEPLQKIPLLCIGTDTSTGDSFGPFVGTLISEIQLSNFVVFGTIENPVHALNIKDYIKSLQDQYKYIIALDSALGKSANIGKINIDSGSLQPGEAVGHELPPVGDLNIHGIVGIQGADHFYNQVNLRKVRLNLVIKMANVTAQAFAKADSFLSLTPQQN